jgi:protease IV
MSIPDPPAAGLHAHAGAEGPAGAREALERPAWHGVLEQFARDYLKDRRSERRWRIFFRLAWLLLVLLVALAVIEVGPRASVPTGPHTALIEIRGDIDTDGESSAENLVPGLRGAFEEPTARAVVLRFNSGGGSPVQAGILNDEVRRLKALHHKPVYAVVEETCASGAYYIAVAADEIYANRASVIGSIGVLMDGFDLSGTLDKLGARRRLITAGENKAMTDPFSPMSQAQRAHVEQMLEQIHQQFIAAVREGRGRRLKETPDTFSGLIWNGQQALEQGLIDHFGTLDSVAREVVKAAEVVDYTPKENVAERLARRFGASMGAGAAKAMQALGALR